MCAANVDHHRRSSSSAASFLPVFGIPWPNPLPHNEMRIGKSLCVTLDIQSRPSWSWQPVVGRNQRYRYLVVNLPEHGKSFQRGPFGMGPATTAVTELGRPRVGTGRSYENDMPNCKVPSAVSSSPAEVSG
jgi:hypothetical protein